MGYWHVTRFFVGGILAGLYHTDTTSYPPHLGWKCDRPIGGSPYVITEVRYPLPMAH